MKIFPKIIFTVIFLLIIGFFFEGISIVRVISFSYLFVIIFTILSYMGVSLLINGIYAKRKIKIFLGILQLLIIFVFMLCIYIGMHSFSEPKYEIGRVPLVPENDQKIECLPDTAPWIKIISPNGGEVFNKEKILNSPNNSFDVSSELGSIPLKLEFCHVNKNGTFSLVLVDENNQEDINGAVVTNYDIFLKDQSIKYSPLIKTGKYKALVQLIDPDNFKTTDSYLSTDLSDDFFLIEN